MENKNSPAAPTVDWDIKSGYAITFTENSGFTKYEKVLAHFMSAMLSNPARQHDPEGLASDAKRYTDAYFEFLETKKTA
ncbi:hypothetical protein [Vibrio paracholerae]|uniref:hypothetical protein n=1 Tax=Vibrio paracholerae TaxID=650003 RepID=UPI002094A53A|nr:hypothetical protein [Vibrio paracholerae]MCO7020868.1 hypothetical protein [Vibrio paracholerae]